jgi:hypothetical protein
LITILVSCCEVTVYGSVSALVSLYVELTHGVMFVMIPSKG